MTVYKHNPDGVWKYITAAFKDQTLFFNAATRNVTREQVWSILGDIAQKSGALDKQTFIAAYTESSEPIRNAWKYGVLRGVYGTPYFFVNGVSFSADPSWTLEQWTQLLDPVINASDMEYHSIHSNDAVPILRTNGMKN
jgi:ADP-heptose:LPS heptosyltransferase